MRMPALALFVVLLWSPPLRSQDDSCLKRTVTVSVLTDYAVPIDGLKPDNFLASLRGDRVPVISAAPNGTGPRVMILIDASGSMLGNKKWNSSLSVARVLVRDAPNSSPIGLAVFNDRLEDNLPPTRDREAIVAEIGRLGSGSEVTPRGHGLTALWDCVHAVANDFSSPQAGDALYILSAGEDNRSSISIGSLRKDLLQSGIRVFFFDADILDGGPVPEERAGTADMQEIAESTGGSAIITGFEFARQGQKP